MDVCATIVREEREEAEAAKLPAIPESDQKHPLLGHPLASDLLAAIERWIQQESLGGDGAGEIAEVRNIAARMMRV